VSNENLRSSQDYWYVPRFVRVLWGYKVFQWRLDVYSVQAGSVPTAPQSLYQQHRRDQPLAVNDGCFLFVAEEILLGTDNIEIAYESANVARVGEVELATRSGNRVGLRLARGVQHLQTGNVVLHLAENVEDGSTILRHRTIVTSLNKLRLCA